MNDFSVKPNLRETCGVAVEWSCEGGIGTEFAMVGVWFVRCPFDGEEALGGEWSGSDGVMSHVGTGGQRPKVLNLPVCLNIKRSREMVKRRLHSGKGGLTTLVIIPGTGLLHQRESRFGVLESRTRPAAQLGRTQS